MWIYIYIHIHIHIYACNMYVYMYAYMYVYIQICIYIYTWFNNSTWVHQTNECHRMIHVRECTSWKRVAVHVKIHDMSDTCCDTHLVVAFYVASFWVILLLNHPQQQQNLWILCHFLSETRRGSAEQSPPDPEIFCMNVAVSCVSYFRKQPPKIEIC